MAIPPQPVHQTSFGMPQMPSQLPPAINQSSSEPGMHALARPSGILRMAGRKRSRDEAAPNLVDETPEPMSVEPPKQPDDEWEYGEGMVLIKRSNGYVADASSQSGTWLDEKAALDDVHRTAAAASARINAQERPLLRSNKSQRLDQDPSRPLGADAAATPSELSPAEPNATGHPANALSSDNSRQPIVDDFTVHLGIGWRKISEDEHIQAAARGWARYIENHYPVSSVNVRLESRGLQAYLVEAAEGFYLFAENLKQGRLVSTNAEAAFRNLKTSPPVFDGQDTLFAADTPGAAPAEAQPLHTTLHPDMDMEMS